MTLHAWDGALLALVLPAAGLSVVAGAAKLAHPARAVRQLTTALGLPAVPAAAGLLVGAAEVALGLAPLTGGPGLVLLGVSYLVYAVAVAVMLRRGSAGCGCFGVADVPPGRTHLVVDLLLAGGCLAAAAGHAWPTVTQAAAGVPAVVAATYLVRALLVELPLLRLTVTGGAPLTFRATGPARETWETV